MQLPKRVVEAVRSCRQAPPQSSVGSLSSDDVDSTAAAASSGRSNKRCGYELKQVRRCLLWFLEACVLLLFCLGLAVLVEFVIVHPRPPECEVVNLTLTRFSASNFNLSYANTSSKETPHHGEHEAGSSSGPIQLLTAVIVIVIRASNGIQRIGTFYDHVHVRVLYNGDVVGEDMVGPFFQARKISNLLQTQVEAHKMPMRKAAGQQLLLDMNDHVVEFQVWVHVLTRVSLLKFFTHHFRVHVWCDIAVMLEGGSSRSFHHLNSSSSVVSKQCRRKD